MFLVDPGSRHIMAASDDTIHAAGSEDEIEHEFYLQQVEIQSAPHRSTVDLYDDLRFRRATAVAAAEQAGSSLAAMPTPVLEHGDGEVTPKGRYERMVRRFGRVGRQALTCGMHVHVDIDDEEEGVAVIDRLGPWLPLVAALSAGSPFDSGVDTGYASWRGQMWEAWPTAGAVEPFESAVRYHATVDALIASGAALDAGMIYFDARLSRTFPTVEIRVADVCADLDTTVMIATVVRALVDTISESAKLGPSTDPWRVDLLRAARWRARRYGLSDSLIDPTTRRLASARDCVETMLTRIGPALDHNGDLNFVRPIVDRLLKEGNGADRQRAVAGPSNNLLAVVDDVVSRTQAV